MPIKSIKDNKKLVYKSATSTQDKWNIIKAAGMPIISFIVCIFAIAKFGSYGRKMLAPMMAAMWTMGTMCSIFLPSHRSSIIKETIFTNIGYAASMLGLRMLAGMASGISSSMLVDSLDLSMGSTQGNTILGYIQNILTLSSVLVPIGFIGLQAKRIISLRRNSNKKKFLDQTRNIRDTNKNIQ